MLKEIGMKGVMSEKLFFLASGILPPMRSRPPAQACLYYSIPTKGRGLMNLNSWEPKSLPSCAPQQQGRGTESAEWGSLEPLSLPLGLSVVQQQNCYWRVSVPRELGCSDNPLDPGKVLLVGCGLLVENADLKWLLVYLLSQTEWSHM